MRKGSESAALFRSPSAAAGRACWKAKRGASKSGSRTGAAVVPMEELTGERPFPARLSGTMISDFQESCKADRQTSIHVPREGDDSKCDGKYIVFSRNICHNKIQRTKTRCIFVQNATVSAAYPHKYPKNDNRLPVRTVRCFSAHCRFAPEPCRPRRAFLYRCLYTSKISSCAHCGARPTCSTLVLYWLPSR